MISSHKLLQSRIIPRLYQTRSFSTKLSEQERVNALATLRGKWGPDSWEFLPDRDAIHKTYIFADFKQAWNFMNQTAELAEQMDHHPEWFNVYNTVEVTWTTHDAGGVTEKDITMAKEMDQLAHKVLPGGSVQI